MAMSSSGTTSPSSGARGPDRRATTLKPLVRIHVFAHSPHRGRAAHALPAHRQWMRRLLRAAARPSRPQVRSRMTWSAPLTGVLLLFGRFSCLGSRPRCLVLHLERGAHDTGDVPSLRAHTSIAVVKQGYDSRHSAWRAGIGGAHRRGLAGVALARLGLVADAPEPVPALRRNGVARRRPKLAVQRARSSQASEFRARQAVSFKLAVICPFRRAPKSPPSTC